MFIQKYASDQLIYDAAEGICTITLNQPNRLNAINKEMRWALAEAADRFEQDASLRVMLLVGSDCGSFSTGSDIKDGELGEMAYTLNDHVPFSGPPNAVPVYSDVIAALRKPVIALIDGYCIGGGLEMALGCDMRIATRGSSFGLPEARLGTLGDYGMDALCRTVPLGEALMMHLTGLPIDADRAYQVGLLQALLPNRQALFAKGHELAQAIWQCSPTAVRTLKHVVKAGRNLPIEYASILSQPFRDAINASPQAAEGARAFRDKAKPSWAPQYGPSSTD